MYLLYQQNTSQQFKQVVIKMGMIINNSKLNNNRTKKNIHFGVDNNLKHGTDFIIKSNEFLAAQTMKNEIG